MDILGNINTPADLKKLNMSELARLCGEIREYMVECCSNNPGHLGSSLGAVELAVALHYVYDTPKDKLVWDVGHQAYAHKIITGRREAFVGNRKKDGISGFPKMEESGYDAFGAGHTSVSISAALGIAEAAELKGEKTNVLSQIYHAILYLIHRIHHKISPQHNIQNSIHEYQNIHHHMIFQPLRLLII